VRLDVRRLTDSQSNLTTSLLAAVEHARALSHDLEEDLYVVFEIWEQPLEGGAPFFVETIDCGDPPREPDMLDAPAGAGRPNTIGKVEAQANRALGLLRRALMYQRRRIGLALKAAACDADTPPLVLQSLTTSQAVVLGDLRRVLAALGDILSGQDEALLSEFEVWQEDDQGRRSYIGGPRIRR
jgi:hypothetical protein